MSRPCTFYVKDLEACQNAYCYYPNNKEIECPVRGFMIARYGDWEKWHGKPMSSVQGK